MKNEERVSATRGRLIDAAINALAQLGYPRTTFVEVSRRSELSRGAIHHHFESIPDLMVAVTNAIYRHVQDTFSAELAAIPANEDYLDTGLDLIWQQLQQPPLRALNQIRGALATDSALQATARESVSHVWEWLHTQTRTLLAQSIQQRDRATGALNNAAIANSVSPHLVTLVLTALSGAADSDSALGPPRNDPDRRAFLATLKQIIRQTQSEFQTSTPRSTVPTI